MEDIPRKRNSSVEKNIAVFRIDILFNTNPENSIIPKINNAVDTTYLTPIIPAKKEISGLGGSSNNNPEVNSRPANRISISQKSTTAALPINLKIILLLTMSFP